MNKTLTIVFFAICMTLTHYVSASTDTKGGKVYSDKDTTRVTTSHDALGVKKTLLKISLDEVNPHWGLTNCWDSVNLAPYPFYYPFFEDSLMFFELDSGSFVRPCAGSTLTSLFERRSLFGRKFHRGVDIDLETGDTVYAVADGKVRFSKMTNGYGNVVVISHINNLAGLETLYGHLDQRFVADMEYVHQGQPIGLGGNTGQSTGDHLHIEFRIGGKSIDPAWIINLTTFAPLASIIFVREEWIRYIDEYDLE